MSDLGEVLDNLKFADVVFPRDRKARADLLEFDALDIDKRKRPSVFLTFAYDPNNVLNQVFISQGKSGGDENAHAQSLGIFTSLGLQHGIPPQAFVRTLKNIQSDVKPLEEKGGERVIYTSIEDLIAHKIQDYVLKRGEILNPDEVSYERYAQQVLNMPEEGGSAFRKLRFGNTDSPPLYFHFDETEEGLLGAVFLTRGKSGGDESAHAESVAKLISLSLQYGFHPYRVARSLMGIKSSLTAIANGHIYQSMEDAIGALIVDWYDKRGVNIEESYNRTVRKEADPTNSLEIGDDPLASFDLSSIGAAEGRKDPCPNCEVLEYELMEKPGTRGCFTYSCCGYEAGACS